LNSVEVAGVEGNNHGGFRLDDHGEEVGVEGGGGFGDVV